MNRLQSEIKDYRKKKGLSQDDLAIILGVTRSKIANWENGRTFPKPDMIQEIANKLGINLTYGDLINDFIDYESTLKKKFKQIEENRKIEISDLENIIKILDESGIKISYKDLHEHFKNLSINVDYYNEFLHMIERHSHRINDIKKRQMFERFADRIRELTPDKQ